MDKSTFIIKILSLSLFLTPRTQAQPETNSGTITKADEPEIVVTKLDISNKTLSLSYEIRNDSEKDVWILVGIGGIYASYDESADAFLDEDVRALLIRRRLDEPPNPRLPFPAYDGRYVRMRPGQIQTESISLPIPIHFFPGYVGERGIQGVEYATRLTIEIGYYSGDLPEFVGGILKEAEKIPRTKPIVYPIFPTTLIEFFGDLGLLTFNQFNENLRSRDDEVLIPYTNQMLKGEQVLRVTVDDLRIPYENKEVKLKLYPPDLRNCTRIEIQYQPSMLEYFFPYAGQQSLLSRSEKHDLQSLRTIVVDDPELIKAFAKDVKKGVPTTGIVRQRSAAHLLCYRGDEHLTSFCIYNDESIVTDGWSRFTRDEPLQSLRMFTPRIKQFELRLKCADNLKDLWNRFRLYDKAEKNRTKDTSGNSKILYPIPAKWCDVMVPAYRSIGMVDYWNMRLYICPSAIQGKCHYAMNPNCKPDSIPNTVLLFETKAGWNQHGGPELFTFDNHEPKGGCVLLNDGTVKFIRTNEELQQLRWK